MIRLESKSISIRYCSYSINISQFIITKLNSNKLDSFLYSYLIN